MQTLAWRMTRFSRSMGFVAILSSLWGGTGWAVCGDGVVDAPSTVSCYGDLDDSRTVTVDELVALVQFALIGGAPGGPLDRGTIGEPVSVELILRAINHALVGCPIGTVNSQEDCDDGGICIGDATAGTACTADADCGAGANGVCAAGSKFLHGCATDDECPGSVCIRCKSFGGDGCSANCTSESILDFRLKPGRSLVPLDDGICLGGGTGGRRCQLHTECSGEGDNGHCTEGSVSAVLGSIAAFAVELGGSAKLRVGTAGADGIIPVAIRATDVDLPRAANSPFFCICPRVREAATCGGVAFYRDGREAIDCTDGFGGPASCPADLPCTALHGIGNMGSGFIGCDGLEPAMVHHEADCNGGPDDTPSEPILSLRGSAGAGAGFLMLSGAVGKFPGGCTARGPEFGADGEPCTEDDPPRGHGVMRTLPFVTGEALGIARNVLDMDGCIEGPDIAVGGAFACNANRVTLEKSTEIAFAGAFVVCDLEFLQDTVVSTRFVIEKPTP